MCVPDTDAVPEPENVALLEWEGDPEGLSVPDGLPVLELDVHPLWVVV